VGLGVALVAGAALGVVATSLYNERKALGSKEILEKVKSYFLKEGSIEVSYIEQCREKWSQFAVQSEVYRGGIVRKEDKKYAVYEFLADAFTGTVVSVERREIDMI
jgi:predicted small secreted protein